jgi:class 3 adenylate cyclase
MWLRGKAYRFLAVFLCLMINHVSAQNKKLADSLAKIYKEEVLEDTAKMELLRNLAFNEVKDLNLSLQYAEELINLARQKGNYLYLHRGYFQKGNNKRLLGDLDEALDAYFKSGEAARKSGYISGEGNTYGAIADIYQISKHHRNAMLYYNKAIATLRRSNDSVALASAISNAGNEFLNNKDYDSALLYFKESRKIFEKINYPVGKAYSIGNMGMVYANIGINNLAEKYINEAIGILEGAGDYYPICVYLLSMSDIYLKKGDQQTALSYAKRSLELARQYKLKEQISDANLKLSELYERAGNPGESLKYYKDHISYRDSVNNIKSVQKMADLRTDYEVAQKQVELDLLNKKKQNQQIIVISLAIILGLTIVILGTLYWYYKTISREKEKSERLLLNILPAETAKELEQNGKVEAVRIDKVTVLFTDFLEFSRLAAHIEPEQLVKSLDLYFKAFDEITTEYGLEKIKTIGDSYMCACGLHTANEPNARNAIYAAKAMIDVVNRELKAQDDLIHFEVRIGIHTGPVVAGIVGTKKWQYDIWGDTVNIASRMQTMSKPGRVNLSETTYQEIKDEFSCEYRGEIEVKNHGLLKMYFLC